MATRPRSTDTIVVLVHGAWHSSLHWAATQRALAAHGVASVAIDLPGHGLGAPLPSGYLRPGQPDLATEKSALGPVTMQDATDVIVEALAGVRRRYADVVLVAHSAGGGPASLAIEQEPDLVDRLVCLSAFVPAGRPRFSDYISAPENAGAVAIPMVADAAELGAFRINPLDDAAALVLRRAFLNDLPADAPDTWRQLLHPDEPYASLTAPAPVTPQGWGRGPRRVNRRTGPPPRTPGPPR